MFLNVLLERICNKGDWERGLCWKPEGSHEHRFLNQAGGDPGTNARCATFVGGRTSSRAR